jgi:hypothetical protein
VSITLLCACFVSVLHAQVPAYRCHVMLAMFWSVVASSLEDINAPAFSCIDLHCAARAGQRARGGVVNTAAAAGLFCTMLCDSCRA